MRVSLPLKKSIDICPRLLRTRHALQTPRAGKFTFESACHLHFPPKMKSSRYIFRSKVRLPLKIGYRLTYVLGIYVLSLPLKFVPPITSMKSIITKCVHIVDLLRLDLPFTLCGCCVFVFCFVRMWGKERGERDEGVSNSHTFFKMCGYKDSRLDGPRGLMHVLRGFFVPTGCLLA